MSHKHKDLIIKWANGAKIQVLLDGRWSDVRDNTPMWGPDLVYRVAPEPFIYKDIHSMPNYDLYLTITEVDGVVTKIDWKQ